jgi:hypothetical protein
MKFIPEAANPIRYTVFTASEHTKTETTENKKRDLT